MQQSQRHWWGFTLGTTSCATPPAPAASLASTTHPRGAMKGGDEVAHAPEMKRATPFATQQRRGQHKY